jgi:hypothetical protein
MSEPTTVGAALDALGITDRPGEELILATIAGTRIRHRVIDDALRGEPLEPDTYVATGRFRAGTVAGRGRKEENVASVFALAIDSDLKDFLGVTAKEVHALAAEQLDADLTEHLTAVSRVCKASGLVPNTIVETGYGYALWYMLAAEDQGDVERARRVYKRLVAALNHAAGWRLADPQVSDAGTRIMRVPGAPNTKGPAPRSTALIDIDPDAWSLERLDEAAAAIEPDTAAPEPVVIAPAVRANISGVDLDPSAAHEIAALVAPYWSSGNRHALALGLAGWFKRNGVSKAMALGIVDACATGDDEREDRITAVETTYARSDNAVVGWSSLRELLPPLTIRRIDDLLSSFWRAQQRANAAPEVEVVMSGASKPALTMIRERAEVASQADDEAVDRAIEYAPLPDVVFQGALGEYVEIMAPCTEAPLQYHVGAFLAANGALAGRCAYTPYASKLVYANQYVMLVGSTGTSKKDTAIRFATEKFAGLPLPPSLTVRTRERWSRIDDAGSDVALLGHLAEHPNSLLILPELQTLLSKMRRKGQEALFERMLELWDANARYENLTKASHIIVENPTLSVIAGIQPVRLRSAVNDDLISSGFVNRWLYFPGEAVAPLADPPSVNVSNAQALLEEIVSRYDDLETLAGGSGPVEIPFSADSNEQWKRFYDRLWYKRRSDPDAGELSARYPDLTRKVALTYALTDLSRAMPSVIEWRHVEAAMALIDWQEKAVETLKREWGGTDETRIEARILAALDNPKHRTDDKGNHRCVSSRKLKQLTYIKGVPTSVWHRALTSLVKSGEVAECYPDGGYELGKYAERRPRQERKVA